MIELFDFLLKPKPKQEPRSEYAKNKIAKERTSKAAYDRSHRAESIARFRKDYAANPEKYRKRKREWYAKNRERILSQRKKIRDAKIDKPLKKRKPKVKWTNLF